MKRAIITIDGVEMSVPARKYTEEMKVKKYPIKCPACGAPAHYCRESNRSNPYFFSKNHKLGCKEATGDYKKPLTMREEIVDIGEVIRSGDIIYSDSLRIRNNEDLAPVNGRESTDEDFEKEVVVKKYKIQNLAKILEICDENRADYEISNGLTIDDFVVSERNIEGIISTGLNLEKCVYLRTVYPELMEKYKRDYYFLGIVDCSKKLKKKLLIRFTLRTKVSNKEFFKAIKEYKDWYSNICIMSDHWEMIADDGEYVVYETDINNKSWCLMKNNEGVNIYKYVRTRKD